MPAQLTHILAGEAILEALPHDSLAPSGEAGKAWFRLGCQGPDLFYHNQRTRPSSLHFGALAHKRDFGVLMEGLAEALIAQGAAGPDPECLAFFLGFATHAAVDRGLHPYIVYHSGWFDPRKPETSLFKASHPFLERLVDLALLEVRGASRTSIDHEYLFPLVEVEGHSPTLARVEAVLAAGLRRAYPLSTSADPRLEERLANTFKDAVFFYRATDPARGEENLREWLGRLDEVKGRESMGLLYPLGLPPGLDIANAGRRTWLHPSGDGRESREGLEELFSRAVAEGMPALEAFRLALKEGHIQAGLASLFGNGSLSLNDALGRPVPPLVASPLPLQALMEAEFRRRIAGLEAGSLH